MFRGGGRNDRRGGFPRSRGRSSYRGSGGHFNPENELMSKLSRFGGRDSEMALEIVNAVLAAKSGDRDDYGPPSKLRRIERGRGGSSYRGGRGGYPRSYHSSRRDEEGSSRKRMRSEEGDQIVAGKNSDGEVAVPDKPAFEVPRDALFCRICNVMSFKSKKAYLEHRDTAEHWELNNFYQRRNTSVLRLIRGHAKVQSLRKDFSEACRICHGTYENSYQDHKKTLEHEIVENFLKWRCCGKYFSSRQEYDDHVLTPFHLVNKYEERLQWKKTENEQRQMVDDAIELKKSKLESLEEQNRITDESLEEFEALKKNLMLEAEEDSEATPTSLPEYDPSKAMGIKFITGEKVFRCKACIVEIVGDNVDAIKAHLRSPDHYFEVVRQTLIQRMKEKKEKLAAEAEKKKLERAEKASEIEESEAMAEEENVDEAECEEEEQEAEEEAIDYTEDVGEELEEEATGEEEEYAEGEDLQQHGEEMEDEDEEEAHEVEEIGEQDLDDEDDDE